MNRQTRLDGIDLCRGLAAFAVILVHSGDESWGIPISDRAIQFRQMFYFAVPFFLAASFYFGTRKLPIVLNGRFWQKKFQRIVLPYLLWSFFYVVSKVVLFWASSDAEQIQQLLSDPVAIIFSGAASYHLYFIPLLLAGNILLYFANYLYIKRGSIAFLATFSVLSIAVYQLLIITNNDFDLGTYTAFSDLLQSISNNFFYQPLRIVLLNLSWVVRCLPYFAISLLLKKLLESYRLKELYTKETATMIFLIFILLNLVGKQYLPTAVAELCIAYSLLLFGIAISSQLTANNLITSLGICSFGIYLIHPFVKSAVEIALIKVFPQLTQSVSIVSILVYSIISFLISWVSISVLHKNKVISQYT